MPSDGSIHSTYENSCQKKNHRYNSQITENLVREKYEIRRIKNIGNSVKNKIVSLTNTLEEKSKRWKENLKIKELKRHTNQLQCIDLSFIFGTICEKQKRERHKDIELLRQLRNCQLL